MSLNKRHPQVAAAQQGDRAALESLLREHADRIALACRNILGNTEDAKDATQVALIHIASRITSFDGNSAFSTWAYRIATNAAIDELRKQRRRAAVPLEQDVVAGSDSFAIVDERDRIDRLLQKIPEDHRVALTLREVHELEYAEIAEILGVPIGTVRSRIARARSALISMELMKSQQRPIHGESHDAS